VRQFQPSPLFHGCNHLAVRSVVESIHDASGMRLPGLGLVSDFRSTKQSVIPQKGGILLYVYPDTSDEINRAKDLLKSTGAEDISSTGESSEDSSKKGRAGN
jgi:hypothetical protein